MEIIAKKEKTTLWTIVVSMLAGIILLPFGGETLLSAILLLVIGVILGILYFRQPEVMIEYDGEKLIFPQGRYAPSEIANVTYHHGRKLNYRNGSLKVYMADGQVFSFHFVANVEEVHNRLIVLIMGAN